MGDKSQFLSMAFATRYPLSTVIPGIALGIGLNHGIAILLSAVIGKFLNAEIIGIAGALIFLFFGLTGLKIDFEEENEEEVYSKLGPIITIASTFFIGELGDKTQIFAMTLAANADNKFLIFMATFSSMMCVSLIGIFVGKFLKKKIPETTIKILSSILFLFFGLLSFRKIFIIKNIDDLYFYILVCLAAIYAIYTLRMNTIRRDEYYLEKIMGNLKECAVCTKDFCNCERKIEIEHLTNKYLGDNVIFIGDIIKYFENIKEISYPKYKKLYEEARKLKLEDKKNRS